MEQDEIEKDDLAEAGRGTDTVMAHLSLGEVVIPRSFLDDPEVLALVKQIFEANEANLAEFTVGDEANKINPETGYPEFFFKKIRRLIKRVAPIAALTFPGVGTALGTALGAGSAFAPIVGGAALGAGTSALTGGNALKGAALGGLGSALSGALSGKLNDTALGRAVSGSPVGDAFRTASGALDRASSGVNDLYSGSALQGAFKSGGEALKSIGIDATGADSAPIATGGGASSYGPQNTANIPTTGAPAVQSSSSFLTPLASALLGANANKDAEEALLAQQRANQQLLAPYAGGFSFTPGDLTQDPGYQFNLQEGNRALDRTQLARGNFFSGNALREAQQFGQGLADNTYNSAFNRALQGRQAGLTGALAATGVNTDIGNIRANARTNTGNLVSGALGALLGGNSFTNTGALQGGTDIQALLRRLGIGNSSYAGA